MVVHLSAGPFIVLSLFLVFSTYPARPETVAVPATADTSIFQLVPVNNFGGADFFNAGTAGNSSVNRGLIFFDLQGMVPPGSLITGGTLTMDVVRMPSGGGRSSNFGLHRLFKSWGEGVQVPSEGTPGFGNLAEAREATWLARFGPDDLWTEPGGAEGIDFSAASSSEALVASVGEQMVFPTSTELVADLQYWVDHPDENHGWLVKSDAETSSRTARSFAARESGFGPTLIIEFLPVPEPTSCAFGMLLLAGLSIKWTRRFRK